MFNLNEYETVEERLAKFITDYPDFRIATELESMADNRFVVKAYLFRTYADGVAFSTGYAEEKVSDRGVNSTSALENCETSAIGRALANAGYAAKGKRASREEMAKVNRGSQDNGSEVVSQQPKSQFKIKGGEELMDMWGDSVENIKNALGAEIVSTSPMCKHGDMTLKEGTSKAGKPYHGYVCTAPKAQQCAAIWYTLSAQGSWMLREGQE